jgi:hypothetical protein
MKNLTLLRCALSAMIISGSTTAYCQSAPAAPKPSDPRVEQLKNERPENLVSEESYSVEWPTVHEKDILWKSRMWRTMDLRDERNALLSGRSMADKGTGGRRKDFTQVVMDGAQNEQFNAYSADDDRFSVKLSPEAIRAIIAADRVKYPNDPITTFRIKQDWMYIGSEQKLVARIIGIAPVRQVIAADGATTEEPLFWVYYPNIRKYLREQPLTCSADPSIQNLDQVFETIKFSSTITEVRNSTAYIMVDGKMMPAGTKESGQNNIYVFGVMV